MIGISLQTLVEKGEAGMEVFKSDLRAGDYLFVATRNSLYTIFADNAGRFRVSGGWFDKHHASPAVTTIRGCTWGGSAIKVHVAASCGLCIEFGNRLVTSPIRRFIVVRRENLS